MTLSELTRWISCNRPFLAEELRTMTTDEIRIRLNELTGLNINSEDRIEDTAHLYVEALKTEVTK